MSDHDPKSLVKALEVIHRKNKQVDEVLDQRDEALARIAELEEQVEAARDEIEALRAAVRAHDQTPEEIGNHWDALLQENDRVERLVEDAQRREMTRWLLVRRVDRTPMYSYSGKDSEDRFGVRPGLGERWKTPREIADDYLHQRSTS